MAIIPHLTSPLRLGADGTLAVVEQDSITEIGQCVGVLLGTVAGSRVELPGYGIPDVTFTTGQQLGAVEQAVATWEPRATGTRISMDIAGDGTAQLRAEIPAAGR